LSAGAAVITGFSANTSLGDERQAGAAARAGLARPAELEAQAWDEEDGAVAVVGHPVPTARGFQGEARLLALALEPLTRLWREAALPAGHEVGLLLGTPDLKRRAERAGAALPRARPLPDRLAALAGLPATGKWRQAFPIGHAGFAAAANAALQLLARGEVEACVVGGVDTLCDRLALAALGAEQRLKTADNPVGLQPGEAAAFLLLEKPEAARRRGAKVLARIGGVGVAAEPRSEEDGPLGQGLLAALRELVAAAGAPPAGQAFFVLDRNGEASRAADWGHCQQRLTAGFPGLLPAAQWDPATSFGDTGAASGALGAGLAIRGFDRRYAPAPSAIVLSASDGGPRAALRLDQVR